MKILCYFGSFYDCLVICGSFLGVLRAILRIAQNFLCCFLQSPKFGRYLELQEQGTALYSVPEALLHETPPPLGDAVPQVGVEHQRVRGQAGSLLLASQSLSHECLHQVMWLSVPLSLLPCFLILPPHFNQFQGKC